jgi:hypothetical protein
MSRSAWLAGMVIPLAAVVAVSTAPVSTAVVAAPQAPSVLTDPGSFSLPSVFPLTITRTGGIAGFRDVMVVAGNGMVTVSRTRQQQPQRCRLTPVAAGRLRTAASQVPWARITPERNPRAAFPDEMFTMVRSPAGGPVRLENPRVGAAGKVFQELLTDLGGGPAASRMCKAA